MPLVVLPATEPDAASSIAIEDRAYSGSPLDGILFPGPFPPGESSESRPALLAKEIRDDREMRLMKVVDTDLQSEGQQYNEGTPIAFAKWLVKDENWEVKERKFGEGANLEACEILFTQFAKAYNARWVGKPHVYLKLLHTDPAHQGRGAGSMLLKALAEETDNLGLPAYLEATLAGKPLYEKVGFREVGTVVGNFEKWGGPKEHVTYLMIREAKS